MLSFKNLVAALSTLTTFNGFAITVKVIEDEEAVEICWKDARYSNGGTFNGYLGLAPVDGGWTDVGYFKGAVLKSTDDVLEYLTDNIMNTDTRYEDYTEE